MRDFLLPQGTIDFFLAHHRGAQVHNPGKVDRCEGREGGLGVSAVCTVELSKVIKLGQLLRCHGPWEELVLQQQRGMCRLQQCFRLPSFLSPLCSVGGRTGHARPAAPPPPQTPARYRICLCTDGATRALALLAGFLRRLARCEKNERTYLLSCKRGGSPRHSREFCDPRIWPTREKVGDGQSETTSECSIGGFPSSSV